MYDDWKLNLIKNCDSRKARFWKMRWTTYLLLSVIMSNRSDVEIVEIHEIVAVEMVCGHIFRNSSL